MQAHMDTVRGSTPRAWAEAKEIDYDELLAEADKIGEAAVNQLAKGDRTMEKVAQNAFKVGFAAAWTMLERRGLVGAPSDHRDTEADS